MEIRNTQVLRDIPSLFLHSAQPSPRKMTIFLLLVISLCTFFQHDRKSAEIPLPLVLDHLLFYPEFTTQSELLYPVRRSS